MAITIEPLDNQYQDTNFTILVGENVLLKFFPAQKPKLAQYPQLERVINISNLPSSEELKHIRKVIRLSSDLKNNILGGYVKKWLSSRDSSPEDKKRNYELCKKQIFKTGNKIDNLEQEINLSISTRHILHFCETCYAFIGEFDNLVRLCPECKTDNSRLWRVNYVDTPISKFFDGEWFEDYMGKVLEESGGWKVWKHGSVMGTSGALHQVDLVAVKEGRLLIAECKSGDVKAKDVSHFIVQTIDVPSHVGVFLSFHYYSSESITPLLKRGNHFLVSGIKDKTDDEVVEEINKGVNRLGQ